MLHSPYIRRLARRAAHRRLRRLGGTQAVAWAVRIPLVTLVVTAVALAVVRRPAPRRR